MENFLAQIQRMSPTGLTRSSNVTGLVETAFGMTGVYLAQPYNPEPYSPQTRTMNVESRPLVGCGGEGPLSCAWAVGTPEQHFRRWQIH